MKKLKALMIVNVVQIIIMIAAIVISAIIIPKIMIFDNSDSLPAVVVFGSESDKYSGYANVIFYGAVPDDGKDDTDAFIKALKTGASLYIPAGTYDVSKTIALKNQSIRGAGISLTTIRSAAKNDAIISASGSVTADDFTLCYASVDNNEGQGEKVAFLDKGMTASSMLRSIKITTVGTGFYSPNSKGSPSVTLEAIEIEAYTYRAIEITDAFSTVIRAAMVSTGGKNNKTAVTLGGVFTIESLALKNISCEYPIEFKNAYSATIKSLVFSDTTATSDALIHIVSSSISAQAIAIQNSKSAANVLIDTADISDGIKSVGTISVLYSDSADLAVDYNNRFVCESMVS